MTANELNLNIFNSIVLVGIIQGLIIGLVVAFTKKYRSSGTLFLASLIVVFSLSNLQYYLYDTGLITAGEFFSIYFVPYQLLIGPLLLYYGFKLLYPEKNLSLGNKLLLLPFFVMFISSTVYKILVAIEYRPEAMNRFFDPFEGLIEFGSIILFQTCVVSLWVKVAQAEWQQRDCPELRVPSIRWFKNILVTFFVLSFLWLCVAVLSYAYDYEDLYYLIWLAVSIMIYWLGHIGIYKYGIDQERKKIRNYSIENKATYLSAKQKNEHIASVEKFLINEKRFLDPTMTLDKVADELRLSKSHLSRIINAELGMGFPDYLNSLRVEEAKLYLNNPDFANYTLVAIGLEAGFNSKTTFNTSFKKLTSLTPSEYRNNGKH